MSDMCVKLSLAADSYCRKANDALTFALNAKTPEESRAAIARAAGHVRDLQSTARHVRAYAISRDAELARKAEVGA